MHGLDPNLESDLEINKIAGKKIGEGVTFVKNNPIEALDLACNAAYLVYMFSPQGQGINVLKVNMSAIKTAFKSAAKGAAKSMFKNSATSGVTKMTEPVSGNVIEGFVMNKNGVFTSNSSSNNSVSNTNVNNNSVGNVNSKSSINNNNMITKNAQYKQPVVQSFGDTKFLPYHGNTVIKQPAQSVVLKSSNNPGDIITSEPKLLFYTPHSRSEQTSTDKLTARQNRDKHFNDHGKSSKQFGKAFETAEEYQKSAQNFINNPPLGAQSYTRQHGYQKGDTVILYEKPNPAPKEDKFLIAVGDAQKVPKTYGGTNGKNKLKKQITEDIKKKEKFVIIDPYDPEALKINDHIKVVDKNTNSQNKGKETNTDNSVTKDQLLASKHKEFNSKDLENKLTNLINKNESANSDIIKTVQALMLIIDFTTPQWIKNLILSLHPIKNMYKHFELLILIY